MPKIFDTVGKLTVDSLTNTGTSAERKSNVNEKVIVSINTQKIAEYLSKYVYGKVQIRVPYIILFKQKSYNNDPASVDKRLPDGQSMIGPVSMIHVLEIGKNLKGQTFPQALKSQPHIFRRSTTIAVGDLLYSAETTALIIANLPVGIHVGDRDAEQYESVSYDWNLTEPGSYLGDSQGNDLSVSPVNIFLMYDKEMFYDRMRIRLAVGTRKGATTTETLITHLDMTAVLNRYTFGDAVFAWALPYEGGLYNEMWEFVELAGQHIPLPQNPKHFMTTLPTWSLPEYAIRAGLLKPLPDV